MTVVFTRTLTANSRFGQQLLAAGQREIEEGLAEVGRDAVRRVNANVAKRYDNTRTGYESKDETKLLGSFRFEIERSPGPGLPAKLRIVSDADERKVAALEYGAKPHFITPDGADALIFEANPLNVFGKRLNKALGPAKGQRQRAPRGTAKAGRLTKTQIVEHPGNREGRFMRDGLDAAIRAAYRKVTSRV